MPKQFVKKILHRITSSVILLFFYQISYCLPTPEGIQVYQKNMHLSEEHKQKLAADLYRYYNADNFWDELRQEFILPHYEEYPQVQQQIAFFMMHPDFLQRSAERAAPYLYYILQQVHRRHLPPELVLLPMIESAYNPFAYSNVGAAGIWQMMPETATDYGVKHNWWYDGRRDVVASTRSALNYLSYLGNFFGGNWLLAIAAYNTGEGNVLSAIKRNIRDGISTDFWSLPVAQQTKDYVPRLLALAAIISHPERYGVTFPIVHNAPYLAQIDIGNQIDLKHAAELAGVSYKSLRQLNPGSIQAATDKLILPIEHVKQFSENLSHSPLNQNWIHYTTRSGDTWASIAKHFNVSSSAIRTANPQLASRLKPGKQLTIPSHVLPISNTIMETSTPYFTADYTTHSTKPKNTFAENKVFARNNTLPDSNTIGHALEKLKGKYSLQPGDTLYMIREGDDIPKIAKRFHVDMNTLLTVNQINFFNKLQPGEKLIIPTHLDENAPLQPSQLASSDTIYVVKHGENVNTLAHKFRVTPEAIRIANLLTTNELQEGDRLVIPANFV